MRLPGQKVKAAASYGSSFVSRECFVKQELLKQVSIQSGRNEARKGCRRWEQASLG